MKSKQINVISLSFLDTFCCALGAMILLFILNSMALSNSVKSAVEKYRVKAVEAQKEKEYAEFSRQDAQKSRNDAELARHQALKARDEAELSEQKAVQNQELARLAKLEADKQKELAEKKAEEAKLAEQKGSRALEDVKMAQARLEQLNQELRKKHDDLVRSNQKLEQSLNQTVSNEKRYQELVARYEQLQKELQRERLAATDKLEKSGQSLESLEQQRKQLQEECERLTRWYKEAKEKITALTGQFQEASDEKKSLAQRLAQKETELQKREQEIAAKEENIRQREAETVSKDKKLDALEKALAKKEDRSLFGVRLSYQRIVFLFDRSGSIIQNNWKDVIVGTCREILDNCDVEEFGVVAFSSDMRFYPPRRGLMMSGSKDNKEKAINWLQNDLDFGGTTHIHEALRIAYEDYGKLDAIFLVTDGLPEAQNYTSKALQKEIVTYIENKIKEKTTTKIISIAIGYPPAQAQQYAEIYKYLHKISELTNGQYLGR